MRDPACITATRACISSQCAASLQWVPELTRMGVCTSLANLEKDPSQNVRRTASTALALFSKQDAEAMACDNE